MQLARKQVHKFDNFLKEHIAHAEKTVATLTKRAAALAPGDAAINSVEAVETASKTGAEAAAASSAAATAVAPSALGAAKLVEPLSLTAVSLVELAKDNASASDVAASTETATTTAAAFAALPAADKADARRNRCELLLQKLSMLDDFLALNCTAVDKIGKKRDKRFLNRAPIHATLVADVERRRPVRAQSIDALRVAVLHLMQFFPSLPMPDPKGEITEMDSMVVSKRDVTAVMLLDVDALPNGVVTQLSLCLSRDALGNPISVPVLVAKGSHHGPTVGITAALHGNELNGIPIIHRVFQELDLDTMRGTLVAIPVLNPEGYVRHQRHFSDGQDLNRLFPGKANGNCGDVFVHHIKEKLLSKFDYNIDLVGSASDHVT
jgi:hypothetical protein